MIIMSNLGTYRCISLFRIYNYLIVFPSSFFCNTTQKMKFSIKNFFSKFEQIRSFLRIWSHLMKKSLMENFIFCAVINFEKRDISSFYLTYDFFIILTVPIISDWMWWSLFLVLVSFVVCFFCFIFTRFYLLLLVCKMFLTTW